MLHTLHPERTNEPPQTKRMNKSKYNVLNEQHQRKRHYVSFATQKKSKHLANKFIQTHADSLFRSTYHFLPFNLFGMIANEHRAFGCTTLCTVRSFFSLSLFLLSFSAKCPRKVFCLQSVYMNRLLLYEYFSA